MRLTREDIPIIPKGVILKNGCLEDKSLGERYPLNDMGALLLGLVDSRRSIESIADAAVSEFNAPSGDDVLKHAVEFFGVLNDSLLVNIRTKFSLRRLGHSLLACVLERSLAPILQIPKNRLSLPWHSPSMGRDLAFINYHTTLAALPLLVAGWFVMLAIGGPITHPERPILALWISVCLHESAHWYAIVRLGYRNSVSCLSRRGVALAICRKQLPRFHEATVIIVGPALPGCLGLFMLIIDQYVLPIGFKEFGIVFALHWASFLPLAQDGQNLLRVLVQR